MRINLSKHIPLVVTLEMPPTYLSDIWVKAFFGVIRDNDG